MNPETVIMSIDGHRNDVLMKVRELVELIERLCIKVVLPRFTPTLINGEISNLMNDEFYGVCVV